MKFVKNPLFAILTFTFMVMIGFSACVQSSDNTVVESYTPGLAVQMKYMSYWAHKVGLSVEAENMELADFYHHELEEAAEDLIDSIESYDGFPIAELTKSMLVPALDALEDALDAGNWTEIRSAYTTVVTSCNTCHVATDHGYIVITEGYGNNPFNQEF
jgi:hypothetical protein